MATNPSALIPVVTWTGIGSRDPAARTATVVVPSAAEEIAVIGTTRVSVSLDAAAMVTRRLVPVSSAERGASGVMVAWKPLVPSGPVVASSAMLVIVAG